MGKTAISWRGMEGLEFQGKQVHLKLEGELLKLAQDSKGKAKAEATVGAVIVTKEGKATTVGYVILKEEKVKSKKLKAGGQKAEQQTDWAKQNFVREWFSRVMTTQFLEARIAEKKILAEFAESENVEVGEPVYMMKQHLASRTGVEGLADLQGIDYDKWAKAELPEAEKAYAEAKAKKDAEAASSPAPSQARGAGPSEGEDEEDGDNG